MQKQGMDWTKILAAKGLEVPGYHECVARTTELTAQKKQAELARQAQKSKKKKKK